MPPVIILDETLNTPPGGKAKFKFQNTYGEKLYVRLDKEKHDGETIEEMVGEVENGNIFEYEYTAEEYINNYRFWLREMEDGELLSAYLHGTRNYVTENKINFYGEKIGSITAGNNVVGAVNIDGNNIAFLDPEIGGEYVIQNNEIVRTKVPDTENRYNYKMKINLKHYSEYNFLASVVRIGNLSHYLQDENSNDIYPTYWRNHNPHTGDTGISGRGLKTGSAEVTSSDANADEWYNDLELSFRINQYITSFNRGYAIFAGWIPGTGGNEDWSLQKFIDISNLNVVSG